MTDVTLGAGGLQYGTSAEAARNALITDQGWTIEGDEASGMACDGLVSSDFATKGHQLTIYPNPSPEQITIKGDQFELEDIRVLNTIGQDVTVHVVIQGQSPTTTKIDLSKLSSGLYFIKSQNGLGVVYKE